MVGLDARADSKHAPQARRIVPPAKLGTEPNADTQATLILRLETPCIRSPSAALAQANAGAYGFRARRSELYEKPKNQCLRRADRPSGTEFLGELFRHAFDRAAISRSFRILIVDD